MRVVWIVLVLLFAIAGAVFGALNSDSVAFDFYLVQADLPKGAALLAALLVGWIAGGAAVWLGVVVPLKRRLGHARRELVRRPAAQPSTNGAASDA
ncbi:MAG TPA: lipopolysaccharide assembly protein LapA domain-containing protein [Tahibacter sp.]|jgi:uncharacterized integral membrane protein|nr:lipopolysaccharide assembly protein LapA domain-containing protein [Tahibacter sp.]